jgi:hypothetical protein
MLRWRVESDVGRVESYQAKGLNGAIEVHVKDSVLAVVTATVDVRQFIPNKEHAIVTRIGFNLLHGRACSCPRLDGRLHPDGRTDR